MTVPNQPNMDLAQSMQQNDLRSQLSRIKSTEVLQMLAQHTLNEAKQGQKGKLSEDDQQANMSALRSMGMPDNEIEIYNQSSPSGKSILLRRHFELMNRGERAPLSQQNFSGIIGDNQEPKSTTTFRGIEWPVLNTDKGLDLKARDAVKKQREKEYTKIMQENRESLRAMQANKARFNRLDDLEKRGNLPSGASKFFEVDLEGNLRPLAQMAGLVNRDTQAFAKTVNDFISDAKSFFGARVTNFDLQSFMRRLPSLLNSAEGRRAIVAQMRLIQELEEVDKELTLDAFQNYGSDADYASITQQVDSKLRERHNDIITKINRLDSALDMMEIMQEDPETFGNAELFWDPQKEDWLAIRPYEREKALEAGMQPWNQ